MPETAEFLLALLRRDGLLAYLDARGISHKVRPEGHPDRPGSVHFDLGGERWVADYWRNGSFKMLIWS